MLSLATIAGLDQKALMLLGVPHSTGLGRALVMASYGLLALAGLMLGIDRARLRTLVMLWAPFVVFIALSVIWADEKSAVVLKTISMTLAIASVAIISASQAQRTLIRCLGWLAVLAGWVSIALALAVPTIGQAFGGMFVGVFVHKGPLADAAVLGSLVAIYLAMTSGAKIWWWIVAAGCVLSVLFSATWSAIFGLGLAIAVLLFRPVRLPFFLGSHAIAISLPLLAAVPWVAPLVERLGRDSTFSGRTYLWDFILRQFEERPLLGAGFHNVGGTTDWEVMRIRAFSGLYTLPSHPHNLWMETLYMGGLIGVAGMVFYLVLFPIRGIRLRGPYFGLIFAILTYAALTAALKVPFYSNSLPSMALILALSLIAIELGQRGRRGPV